MDYLGVAISQPVFLDTPRPILSSLPRRDPSTYLEDLTRLSAVICTYAQQTSIVITETLRAEL